MSEQELIQGIKEKDENAFREIISLYQKGVMNTCLAMVHDQDDAEDLAQEVFIELLQSFSRFRADAKISTWLYRVAVNKSLNHLSRKKRRSIISGFENLLKINGKEVTHNTDHLEISENRKILHNAIDSLPKNQKIAFTLHKYDDLSYKDISAIMNLSVSSVESLMFRAKQNLSKKLEKYYKSEI